MAPSRAVITAAAALLRRRTLVTCRPTSSSRILTLTRLNSSSKATRRSFTSSRATPARISSTVSCLQQIHTLTGRTTNTAAAPSQRSYVTTPSGLDADDTRVEGTIGQGVQGATPGVDAPDYLSESERTVFEKLKRELEPLKLEVQDISGGCGSMFAIDIVSARFKGLPMIKQHRVVNDVLRGEIGGWHGVQLKTRAEI
ncbi:MAG: hypothetical protein M1837_004013 [Sclerophora amabilis]|nr:MAG: hypothetical protein M1837_004013 [Sclerophora amabilis]